MEPQRLSQAIYRPHKSQIPSFGSQFHPPPCTHQGGQLWQYRVAVQRTPGASAFHQPTEEWRANRNCKLLRQKYLPGPKDGELHTLASALARLWDSGALCTARGRAETSRAPPGPRTVPGAQRNLTQSRVSGLALGRSMSEYTAPKCSRFIRITFLQTIDAQPLPARAQLLADPSSPARISSLALQKGILDGSAAEPGMVGEKWTLLSLSRTHSTSGLRSLLQSSSSEWPEGAHLSGWHLLLLCHLRSCRSVTQLRGGGGGKRQGRESGAEEGEEVGSTTRRAH